MASVSSVPTDYKKLALRQYPRLPGRRTAESRYWRKFKFPVLVKEFDAVTNISFSGARPHDFAVTSSTRVQIYSAVNQSVKKTISRFKDVAYGATFRRDGKLLVAGGQEPVVQLFDMGSRATLRSFKGHLGAVHVTTFSPNNTVIMSASDDRTVRGWDIPGDTELFSLEGHTDYIRTGLVAEDNPDLWLSGSYDHTVRLWDVRTQSSVMTLDHGAPVESLLMFPGGGLVVSAGGNYLRIWDVIGGGRMLQSISNHQKTITGICFDANRTRLLSCSLDQHIKIYNVQDYKVTHSVKYPAPVLCIGLSPDDTHLVAGMTSGLLSIRHRAPTAAEKTAVVGAGGLGGVQRAPRMVVGTYRYFVRGKRQAATQADFKVEERRKPRLRQYDVYLKKFQYRRALDAAFETKQRAIVIVSLLQELVHRGALVTALAGRDDEHLAPILRLLVKQIANPRYSSLLIDVANIVLDMYAPVLGQSIIIDDLIGRLRLKLQRELAAQKDLLAIVGAMDLIFAQQSRPLIQ